jgi:hypothetical protein
MKLVGAGQQQKRDNLYDASGTIALANTPQLVLPQRQSTSFLLLQSITTGSTLTFEFGSARATCTIVNGQVATVTVTNAGFNFTKAPNVKFLGGGNAGNSAFLGGNQPGYPAPSHPAVAHAVLTAGAVSSIVIDDPGAGYVIAPFVMITNDDLDPYGCAVPALNDGLELSGVAAPIIFNGTCCPTDAISVFGANANSVFVCKWMD